MEKIKVSVFVSNFQGLPLADADVHFQDENFKNLYSAVTDTNGKFEIMIEKRKYNSVFACKDYTKNYLEFWYWNYDPTKNPVLDIKIDGIELYGMKAWETKPAYPGLMVFFRPMSLKRWKQAGKPKNGPALIAPELELQDIKANINGISAQVIGVNKVKEQINESEYMEAYLINVSTKSTNGPAQTVCLEVHDRKLTEHGMGCIDL